MRGFLFGLWKLGEGVVVLRFLWGWFRTFFVKTFHWVIWVCGGFGRCSGQSYGVKRVKAGRRGRKSCASCSAATWWRVVGLEGVCCGKHTEIWRGRWGV